MEEYNQDYKKLYDLLFKENFVEVYNEKFTEDDVFIDMTMEQFVKKCEKYNITFKLKNNKNKEL